MLKRIGLLILTNIAIVVMLNVILSIVGVVFGINWGGMAGKSINLTSLSIYALIIGFTGSIFSLLTSKMIAKSTMGLQMIDIDNPSTNLEAWLVSTVRELANRAKLRCLKWRSTRVTRTRLPRVRPAAARWSLFPPVFFS